MPPTARREAATPRRPCAAKSPAESAHTAAVKTSRGSHARSEASRARRRRSSVARAAVAASSAAASRGSVCGGSAPQLSLLKQEAAPPRIARGSALHGSAATRTARGAHRGEQRLHARRCERVRKRGAKCVGLRRRRSEVLHQALQLLTAGSHLRAGRGAPQRWDTERGKAARAPRKPRTRCALCRPPAPHAPPAAARRVRGWSRSAAQTAQAHTARRRWKRRHPAAPSKQSAARDEGPSALQTRAMVPAVVRLRERAWIWDGRRTTHSNDATTGGGRWDETDEDDGLKLSRMPRPQAWLHHTSSSSGGAVSLRPASLRARRSSSGPGALSSMARCTLQAHSPAAAAKMHSA